MISLYDSKETVFTSNGLVVLSDAISCLVTEGLNGSFECAIEYPLDERGKWQYLIEDNIIKADGQLFRIYHRVKTLNSVLINARHIFYDLLENLLEDVRPTSLSGQGALDYLLTRTQYVHPFTSMGDVGGINTKHFVRKNPVDAIMGDEGIIAAWGGELVRDNFLIKLLGARGLDRGVLVAYGKNIQGIEETLDTSGICTRLMPIGKDGLLLTEKYIDSPYINNYPFPKIKVVEFSDVEDETTLRAVGVAYMLNAKIDIPHFNYKIDFLELSKTEEYKDYAVLERVYEGDTVTIRHSKLGIDLKAKVIKIIKNVLTDKIEKVELGSFKPNIATGINDAIQGVRQEIVQVTSAYQKAIDNATALITGSTGGNVVIRTDEAGKPYEILIMDTNDVMTAVNVWRWNLGGFGYSSTGINGPYEVAITMDGHIVASFITALVINGEQIIAGIIQSKTGKWLLNLDGETFNLGDKLVFDGTNLTFGAGVTLSWGAITGTPSIPTQYTDAEALVAWEASGYKTFIDANGIYTGTLTALQINVIQGIVLGSNATISWGVGGVTPPTAAQVGALTQLELVTALTDYITTGDMSTALADTLNTGNFSTIITNAYIASMNLIVGNEITMGANAYIGWNNVTSKPSIPSQYTNAQALAAWEASGYKTYIDANGIYTGTLTALQIMAIVGITSLNISGTLNCGETLEIGPPNAVGGQCHINTFGDGIRFQAHVPGNYMTYWDNGNLSFFINDVCVYTIYPDGGTDPPVETKIYGVKIDTTNSNPATALTYTDDAVGFTPAQGNNGAFNAGSWADKFPFNQIKPCLYKNGALNYYLNPNNYAQKEDGVTASDITSGADGDVMSEFPKIWWKFETIGTDLYVRYSDAQIDAGYKCLAHMRGITEKDKCYISSYLGYDLTSKLRSLSGKTPTGSQTIGAFRTLAQANGTGYDQIAYFQLLMLQVLFTVMFKSRDSQTALGRGYVDANATAIATGGTNAKGMFYGETTGKLQNKFCGIEDFFGNLYYWIDGFFSSAAWHMLIANQNFNDTGSGYTDYDQGATANLSGYISVVQGGTETGFVAKVVAGSATTYYADAGHLYASTLTSFGGAWTTAGIAGAFYLGADMAASHSYASIGARLLAL